MVYRLAAGVTHDPPAPEDPADLAVRPDDAVLHLVEVVAAVEHLLKAVGHPIAIVWMAQRAQAVDGDWTGGRLQAHELEELRPAPQHAGRHVDVPHADAGRPLGQLEDLFAFP